MCWRHLPLLLALTGCAGGAACPLIGCASQLTVRLPAGIEAGTACVAGVCTSTVVEGQLQVPLGRRAEGSSAVVTVTLPAAPSAGAPTAYEGEVPVTRTRPNGENCPPVCVNGTAELDLTSGQVVEAAAPAPS